MRQTGGVEAEKVSGADWLERLRQAGTVLFYVWAMGFVAVWALKLVDLVWDVPRTAGFAVLGIAAVVGLIGGVVAARELEPWDQSDRRDAIIGWGGLILFVITIAGAVLILGD